MNNKYYWHGRISERKFRQLVRCFAEDKTAAETASETNLDRKSVNNIFLRIRRRILEASLKNRPHLSVKGLKTKKPYFVAESEAECKKYSTKYKSSVLVVLFESEIFRFDIIYAESDETFGEIHKLADLRNKRIANSGFYDILGKPLRVYDGDAKIPRRMHFTNYPVNLFIYFLWRIKKFRGISPEKIILHLKETEWRLNKISTNLKLGQAPRDEIKLFNKVSKDLYDELLETLRNNPL